MPRSPGFDASFGDGLGNQLPAFTQAHLVCVNMTHVKIQEFQVNSGDFGVS